MMSAYDSMTTSVGAGRGLPAALMGHRSAAEMIWALSAPRVACVSASVLLYRRHSTGGFFAAPAQGSAPVARLASPLSDPPRLNRTRTIPMALPDFTMRQLLEAGAHFGHQSHRWNPKMEPFIYGSRNSIHIIDLAQTVPLLHQALKAVSDTVAKGGRVLFVGTKRQASDEIAAAAKRSAQYFVNARWLGGMLTNWKTISASISRLRKVDELLRRRREGADQEGALDVVARARETRDRARRHQGHGRRSRSGVSSSTPTRKRWRSRKPTGSRFR